ncbi:hypothetical protein D3C85_958090 [compost metagenome]
MAMSAVCSDESLTLCTEVTTWVIIACNLARKVLKPLAIEPSSSARSLVRRRVRSPSPWAISSSMATICLSGRAMPWPTSQITSKPIPAITRPTIAMPKVSDLRCASRSAWSFCRSAMTAFSGNCSIRVQRASVWPMPNGRYNSIRPWALSTV